MTVTAMFVGVLSMAAAGAGGAPVVEDRTLELPRASAALRLAQGLERGAWPGALRLARFFESFPGDRTPPPVESVAFLIRDAEALFVAVHSVDPDPSRIRAPLVERDHVFSDQDFVQVEVDATGDGRSSRLFRVNPRGVQGDGVYDETTGADDFAPDFPYECRARRDSSGWVAALRIPLGTLPAPPAASLRWRVVIFRNYPRELTHQMTSVPIPRGSGCWLCHATPLVGAPYAQRHELSLTPYATLASPAETASAAPSQADAGADLRWTTPRGTTVDATLWPDFSQVESDVPRIDTNARFALSHPEKRPFFMAGSELFATPIAGVYTRSVSTPRFGLRATGASFAVLLVQDTGGGSVVVPGPTSSDRVPQELGSLVAAVRYRRSLGAGLTPGGLVTRRETAGGGHNWVFGPDLDWRPNPSEHVSTELLLSTTVTPRRPDLHEQWDGRRLDSHALSFAWSHSTDTLNASLGWEDIGSGFRADAGFVPQVDVRRWRAGSGYSFYPGGWLSQLQPGGRFTHTTDASGRRLLERTLVSELSFQGRWGMSGALGYHDDRTRLGGQLLDARYLSLDLTLQPSRRMPEVSAMARLGEGVDTVNGRVGRGGALKLELALRPEERLGLELHAEREWLDVATRDPIFSAQVLRLKLTWSFDARSYLRLIAQHERVRRNPDRYQTPVTAEESLVEWSLLFAYRLGWRTSAFAGYAESSPEPEVTRTATSRQLFFKVAYELRR